MLVDGSCFIVLSGSLCFDNIGEKRQELNRGMRDMQSHHVPGIHLIPAGANTGNRNLYPLIWARHKVNSSCNSCSLWHRRLEHRSGSFPKWVDLASAGTQWPEWVMSTASELLLTSSSVLDCVIEEPCYYFTSLLETLKDWRQKSLLQS